MGLFDFFKNATKPRTTDNGVLGPTFFDGLTENLPEPDDLQPHEWRRQLKSKSGNRKFRIKFYGQLHDTYPTLIVGTEFAPSLIVAVDVSTSDEILLFDGCRHGYNAVFCDTFTKEQIENRTARTFYNTRDGIDMFEIILSTYNGFDFYNEFGNLVDENGLVETIDGSKVALEKVRRDAFDTLQIIAVTATGERIEIVSEELA